MNKCIPLPIYKGRIHFLLNFCRFFLSVFFLVCNLFTMVYACLYLSVYVIAFTSHYSKIIESKITLEIHACYAMPKVYIMETHTMERLSCFCYCQGANDWCDMHNKIIFVSIAAYNHIIQPFAYNITSNKI